MEIHKYLLNIIATLSVLSISISYGQPANVIEGWDPNWNVDLEIVDNDLISGYGTPDLLSSGNKQVYYSGDGEGLGLDEGSGSESEIIDTTTTIAEATTEKIATTAAPEYQCTAAGVFTNPDNCNEYIQCTAQLDGTLVAATFACPPKMAYNTKYQRCTRDLSDCQDNEIVCTFPSKYPVANDNTTYWWCTPAIIGGYHKYLVQCPTNEYYIAEFATCFYDWNNLPTLGYVFGQPKDIDAVKMELKQFKREEKQRLKEQKLKEKAEKKLQKELAKQAEKEAKAKAKLIDSNEDLSTE